MIIILMALLSLCAISFTHLLYVKKLKAGSLAIGILYLTLVSWTYLIFFVDVANLGFKDSRSADLIGSVVFHSFTDIRDVMSVMPEGLHVATAMVSTLVAVFVIIELIVSSIRIYNAILEFYEKIEISPGIYALISEFIPQISRSIRRIFILHCRLNN